MPHRKITIRGNEVVKEALDNIGILQNQEEISILRKYKIKYHGDNLCLKHSYSLPNLFKDNTLTEIKSKCQENKTIILGIGATLIGTVAVGYAIKKGKIKSILKGIGGISALGIINKSKKKIIKTLLNSKHNDVKEININTWNDNIFFNYILGECEVTSYSKKDIEVLINLSFYHRIKK